MGESAVKLILNEYRRALELFLPLFVALSRLEAETQTDPFQVAFKHLESKGIGFNKGYSTLETFFASTEAWEGKWLPFLDLRGHLFNNGRSAVNSGIGVRYLAKRVWGGNLYYDYRKTDRGRYNQVALGLESLGEFYDFRLNLYHPFGKKVHGSEFALDSYCAEAGIHVKKALCFAAGPYYLNEKGKVAWGGKVRGNVVIYDHALLEVGTSYDHLFQWVVQGQLTISFTFGGKKEGKPLPQRSLQSINRWEIIPVTQRR